VKSRPSLTDSQRMDATARTLLFKRSLVVALLAGCYITVASLTSPRDSMADFDDPLDQDMATPDEAPLVLGEIVSRDMTVRINAGEDEPTYTVTDDEGTILVDQITAEELRRQFPDLPDVTQFRADGEFENGAILLGDVPGNLP
jgi:hypothetical protein